VIYGHRGYHSIFPFIISILSAADENVYGTLFLLLYRSLTSDNPKVLMLIYNDSMSTRERPGRAVIKFRNLGPTLFTMILYDCNLKCLYMYI